MEDFASIPGHGQSFPSYHNISSNRLHKPSQTRTRASCLIIGRRYVSSAEKYPKTTSPAKNSSGPARGLLSYTFGRKIYRSFLYYPCKSIDIPSFFTASATVIPISLRRKASLVQFRYPLSCSSDLDLYFLQLFF